MTSTISIQNLPAQATTRDLPDRAQVAFLPLHFAVTGLVVVAGLTAIGWRVYEPQASHDPIALATGLTAMGLVAYARYVLRLPWMSASVVYLALFWMFHFGMTFIAAVTPEVLVPMEDWELEWLNWPNVRMAMLLGMIGAAAFALGVGLWGNGAETRHVEPAGRAHDAALYTVGWLMMLAGIGVVAVLVVLNGGPALLSLPYLDFRRAMLGPTMLQSGIDYSQAGCLLAICGAGERRWVAPLSVWTALIGLPMMLLGLRAEAMIPLVSFAIVMAARGVHFHRGLLATAVLGALVVIPAVKVFRDVGFANRSLVNWTELTPVDTFMELGGSLQATKAYVDWIEDGDPYLLGASYWAPVDRQLLVRVLPWREPIPYEDDERVPARLMDTREGSVGQSATGEAYYNFGPLGPLVYFVFVGALFGGLERRVTATPYGCAFLGMTMFLFYFNIRGDWLAIPVQLGQFLVLLGFCYVLGRLAPSRAPLA